MRLWPWAKPNLEELARAAATEAVREAKAEIGGEIERALISSSPNLIAPDLVPGKSEYEAYRWDNPYTWAVPQAPTRRPQSSVSVQTLRALANNYDPLRACIQHLKREILSVPLEVVAAEAGDDRRSTKRAVRECTEFLAKRGGLGGRGRLRSEFESALIEDLSVIGVSAVYYRPRRDGLIYEAIDLDASTIRPRVDAYGWPGPGDAKWEQWVLGTLVRGFTPEELDFRGAPTNSLTYSPYPSSPVEWLINCVNSAIRADDWNRQWLVNGNTPSDLLAMPDSWTPDQVRVFAEWWDTTLSGDSAQRQKTRFVPGGSQKVGSPSRKDQEFQQLELWLLRRCCAIMGVQPASIGFAGEQYKVSQNDSMQSTSYFGAGVLLEWRRDFYDDLFERMGFPNVKSKNVVAREEEAKGRADRNHVLVGAPVKTINEAREEEGLPPVEGGNLILIPNNVTPLGIAPDNAPESEKGETANSAAAAGGTPDAKGDPPDVTRPLDGDNKVNGTRPGPDGPAPESAYTQQVKQKAKASARNVKPALAREDTGGRWITVNGRHIYIDKAGTPHTGKDAITASKADGAGSKSDAQAAQAKGNARPGMHPAAPEERKALAVPPAWTDVHVADDTKAPLQVIGTDTKGRTQYRYSAAHTEAAAAAKFARGKTFDKMLPNLLQSIGRDLNGEHAEEAAVLRLIAETGFRVGGEGDTGAEKQAYGASTLKSDHVKVEGDKVTFEFTGKKGVPIKKEVESAEIAALVRARMDRERLFETSDARVRDYLHSIDGQFKVKDFRTWHGTGVAAAAVATRPAPKTEAEYRKARLEVARIVAEHLGNTPDVALSSYIDPAVFAPWESNMKGAA